LVMQGKMSQAARAVGMLLSAFGEGNFFIEITALDERDTRALPQLVSMANDLRIPIVATNDVLYPNPEHSQTALALAAMRYRGSRSSRSMLREPPVQVVGDRLQGNAELEEIV